MATSLGTNVVVVKRIQCTKLRGNDTLSGRGKGEINLSKNLSLPFEKRVCFKRKEFAHIRSLVAKSFLFKWTPFQKGLVYRKTNSKLSKLFPLSKKAEKVQSVTQSS